MDAIQDVTTKVAIALKVFKPVSNVATQKVQFLVDAGSVIVAERVGEVVLHQRQQRARIDQFGRVEWTPLLPERVPAGS